jgi:hypothetical protein
MKAAQTVKKKNVRLTLHKKKTYQKKAGILMSHNFSDVEDGKKAFEVIAGIASLAGKNAAAEARVKGLGRTYIRQYKKLVQVSATGIEVSVTPRINGATYYIKYKPHTVLHTAKK